MRDEHDAGRALELYADMVRRICFVHLNNEQDTEDVFQEVFLKYILYPGAFESEAHERAWLARVAINACKDLRRRLLRHPTVSLEQIEQTVGIQEGRDNTVLEAVLALPDKYKDVVYLHYYEGYSQKEVAELLHKKENTVYSLLSRAREKLKIMLGGENIG